MTGIKCDNLSLGYGDRVLIDNLNIMIKPTDYLVIIGENGAGKSTLLKAVLGLERPVGGRISFEGISKKDISYLPQQSNLQKNFPASVYEIVISGCLNNLGIRPYYTGLEKKTAMSNIEKMGIAHIAKKSFRYLSGGQQQRVLLARALCGAKKMLFLDEPVSGLDPNVSLDMYKILKNLNDSGVGIVMVSHDPISALNYATKVLEIGKKNYFYGSIEEFYNKGDKEC